MARKPILAVFVVTLGWGVACTSSSGSPGGGQGNDAAAPMGDATATGGATGTGGMPPAPGGRGAGGKPDGAAGAPGSGGAGAQAGAGGALVFRDANLTNFESYPAPDSEECVKFNGCMWAGQFAAVDGVQPESWVMSHDIIAVHEKDFAKYKLKTLRLQMGSKQIDATVYDECADSDCDGCCTKNSAKTGFLIDIEKYTMQRFGSGDGIVQWSCLDCN